MAELLSLVGLALAAATALPMLHLQRWWVRVFDFPRLQIAIGLVLVLALHGLWVAATPAATALRALLMLALAVQLRRMWPYTRLVRRQVQDSVRPDPRQGIRLLFANVLQDNRNAAGLLDIVRRIDPDLVLALETDAWWAQALQPLAATHPQAVRQPQDNTYGMLLYSRLPLLEPRVRFLVQDDVPSIHARVRLPSGTEIALRCLHPRPPAPGEAEGSAERDAELLVVGREIRQQPGPVVVMGDMNDVAWSHTSDLFRDMSGLLDPRIGRGFFNTFSAKMPLLRFPLDHFFHSNDFRLVDFRRLEAFGSDHFPVFIHLSHEPRAEAEQPEPRPDAAERAESSRKIARAGAVEGGAAS